MYRMVKIIILLSFITLAGLYIYGIRINYSNGILSIDGPVKMLTLSPDERNSILECRDFDRKYPDDDVTKIKGEIEFDKRNKAAKLCHAAAVRYFKENE